MSLGGFWITMRRTSPGRVCFLPLPLPLLSLPPLTAGIAPEGLSDTRCIQICHYVAVQSVNLCHFRPYTYFCPHQRTIARLRLREIQARYDVEGCGNGRKI